MRHYQTDCHGDRWRLIAARHRQREGRAHHLIMAVSARCGALRNVTDTAFQSNDSLSVRLERTLPHHRLRLVSLIDRFVVQLSQVFMLRVFLVGTIC